MRHFFWRLSWYSIRKASRGGTDRRAEKGNGTIVKHYRLEIDGMGCAHCIHSVKDALEELHADVNDVKIGSADVLWDGDPEDLRAAVSEAGYEVKSIVAL